MKKYLIIMILAFGTSGCARVTGPGGLWYRSSQERKLSRAVTLLGQGKTTAAATALTSICADPPVLGVSDEALFRLSLLRLVSEQESGDKSQTQHDLERLTLEYPGSSWGPMASNLSKFLATTDHAHQLNRKVSELNAILSQKISDLKELNLSLTQKNKDLKGSNLLLTQENSKLKESILSLLLENTKLRLSIKQIKTLDLELEKAIKR